MPAAFTSVGCIRPSVDGVGHCRTITKIDNSCFDAGSDVSHIRSDSRQPLRVAADHPKTGASFRELLTDGRAYATGGADDDRHLARKPLLPIAHVHFFPLCYSRRGAGRDCAQRRDRIGHPRCYLGSWLSFRQRRASMKTPSSMSSVNRPVKVFC